MSGNNNLISSREVAMLIGKSERHVQTLAKSGVLTVKKVGTKNVYEKYKVIQQYIEYLTKKDAKKFSSLEDEKTNQEIRLKSAKADMVELELEELKGNMHRAEDVEEMTTDLVMTVRSSLLSLPGRIGVEVVNTDDAAVASEIIRKEVCEILEDLSRYKYDPEEYKKRVRERQGWKDKISEEEENSE